MIPEDIKSEPIKLIIPMAGGSVEGKNPYINPFMEIAGKSILHHIIGNATAIIDNPPAEISFILNKENYSLKNRLEEIAGHFGAQVNYYVQGEPLGTANALYCASNSLSGQVLIVYADTLFESDFQLKGGKFNAIWVKKVEVPEKFGVVRLNEQEEIIDFVEKPQGFVSNLALVGAYFMKDATLLKQELEAFMEQGKQTASLTDVLRAMMEQKIFFEPALSKKWFDCEDMPNLLAANRYYLGKLEPVEAIEENASVDATIIHSPVYIGKGAVIKNAVIGPNVSIAAGVKLEDVIIKNSAIQEAAEINNLCMANSVVCKHQLLKGKAAQDFWDEKKGVPETNPR